MEHQPGWSLRWRWQWAVKGGYPHYGYGKRVYGRRLRDGLWWHWWTPSWHHGRGPYISIGLGLFAIYRGY